MVKDSILILLIIIVLGGTALFSYKEGLKTGSFEGYCKEGEVLACEYNKIICVSPDYFDNNIQFEYNILEGFNASE